MNRPRASALAHETAAIVERGSYTLESGRVVEIASAIAQSKRGTVLYALETMPAQPASLQGAPARIEVTTESTFEAMARLAGSGADAIGCLNFASAKNPGGGFLNGAIAQEEALCRSSTLYASLLCAPAFYEQNRVCGTCIYLDLAIVSPGVALFRTDNGTLLERPVIATVITSPAPNAGAVMQNEPQNADAILPALTRRAEMVLGAAALHGVKNLVLGAWGCGVFRNDPTLVARVFSDLLEPAAAYARSFERVVFAVFDPGESKPNFTAFRDTLQRRLP